MKRRTFAAATYMILLSNKQIITASLLQSVMRNWTAFLMHNLTFELGGMSWAFLTPLAKVFTLHHVLAVFLDEEARKYPGVFKKCLSALLFGTASERIIASSSFFRLIFAHPSYTMGVVAIVYLVFLILYLPLFILSKIITWVGSMSCLVGLIVLFAQWFAKIMTFPGSLGSFRRDTSIEFMKQYFLKIENYAVVVTQYATTVNMLVSGKLNRGLDVNSLVGSYHQVLAFVDQLRCMHDWIKVSVQELLAQQEASNSNSNQQLGLKGVVITDGDKQHFQALLQQMEDFFAHFDKCQPHLLGFCQRFHQHQRSRSSTAFEHVLPAQEKAPLLVETSLLLKSCQELRQALMYLRPSRQDGEATTTGANITNIITKIYQNIFQLNQEPTEMALLSFPVMRQQIKHYYHAEQVTLTGADGQLIDALFIPAKKRDDKTTTTTTTTTTGLTNEELNGMGTVLYCAPNAGVYENLASYINSNSGDGVVGDANAAEDDGFGWCHFYHQLGFSLFFFNYRGYGRSAGSPSPSKLKKDGSVVMNYLQYQRCCRQVLVHGESLGGMVACHLACKHQVRMLVVDRSFSSLDAVAARMLGWWGAYGLLYLNWWSTNSVADFLAIPTTTTSTTTTGSTTAAIPASNPLAAAVAKGATGGCHKVILQDPRDQLIRYPSSLLSGVATSLLLNDNNNNKGNSRFSVVPKLPRKYEIALYLATKELMEMKAHGYFVPNKKSTIRDNNNSHRFANALRTSIPAPVGGSARLLDMLRPNNNNNNNNNNSRVVGVGVESEVFSITEEFVAHLYASLLLLNLQYQASRVTKQRKNNNNNKGIRSQQQQQQQQQRGPLSGTHSGFSPINTSNSNNSSSHDLEGGFQEKANTMNEDDDEEDEDDEGEKGGEVMHQQTHADENNNNNIDDGDDACDDDDGTSDDSADTNLFKRYIRTTTNSNSSNGNNNNNGNVGSVNYLQSVFSLEDVGVTAVEKVWVCVCRLDLDQQQVSLAASLKHGFDFFRTWLCHALVWKPSQQGSSCCNNNNSGTERKKVTMMELEMPAADVLTALHTIVDTHFSNNNNNNNNKHGSLFETVHFVVEALQLIYDCQQQPKGHWSYNNNKTTTTTTALDRLLERATSSSSSSATGTTKYQSIETTSPLMSGSCLEEGSEQQQQQQEQQWQGGSCMGRVITLNTGHGGWPSDSELRLLKIEIQRAGFPITID